MTSLQSDHSARPIRTQRKARPSMIPSGTGALPWADDATSMSVLCGCTDTSACTRAKHQTHKHTFAPTHTQKSNTFRQLYLFSLSPWKCTGDQARARWTAYAFSTFLLPGQSNNIRPRWCSKVGPGPRSLSAGSTAGGGALRGGVGERESTRPARRGLIPDPRAPLITV